ncbi:hypothetical protein [Nostoc sp.]|uniref:hypothetical protein n=1 Tax=Nostoc sp. TaxID=1180 RepID=UPI002FF462FE
MINNIFKRFAVSTACAVLSLGVMKADPTLAATFSISAREIALDGNLTFVRNYFGAFSGEDSNNDFILTLNELSNFTFESEPFDDGRKVAYKLADLESFTYNLSSNELDLSANKFFDFSCGVGSDVRLYYSSNSGRGGFAAGCESGTFLTSLQVVKIPSEHSASIPEAGTTTALILWGVGGLLKKRVYLTKTL